MADRDYEGLFKAAQIALRFITKEYSSEVAAALDGDPLIKKRAQSGMSCLRLCMAMSRIHHD